ncbi:glycosyltransferase family 4 protein [Halomonas sp. 141]|uniref:glycosyltransferase family 4 protein n=1 Tax=Halomonas sp. 141 TaxID=2056666 RepID=UPI0018E1FAA9|nr:glycosyltransferase family 1 protein [Halomonas sp. 141]
MKLLTDLDCLAPPLTGIGHYTRELTQRLMHAHSVHEVRAMFHGRFVDTAGVETLLNHALMPGAAASAGLLTRLKPLVRELPMARWAWQRVKAQRFAAVSRQWQPDVYWEPNFILKPAACPAAVTIYDLSPLALPELHPASRIALLKQSLISSVARADRVVTISRFTAQALETHLGVASEKVRLVPPAAGADFHPYSEHEQAALRERYELPARFILSVGTLEPRKNLSRLLSAYERLPDALRADWPLVCVGAKGWNDAALSADIERLSARGELIRLGYVPQQDLPCLTAAAGLMAYLSIYEGFGMPVVEAMACGTPVLTSQGTVMEEVAEQCAFYADPLSVESIHAALESALHDVSARERFTLEGPAMAAKYCWADSAQVLHDTLAELT